MQRETVRKRERECLCVGQRESVCVCGSERERVCVWMRECVYVWVRESGVCVGEREREDSARVAASVCSYHV